MHSGGGASKKDFGAKTKGFQPRLDGFCCVVVVIVVVIIFVELPIAFLALVRDECCGNYVLIVTSESSFLVPLNHTRNCSWRAFFEQVEHSSDNRCVLACTHNWLKYFYLYLCIITTLSSSDSHTFLFAWMQLVCDRQMDRRTDGQTDRRTYPIIEMRKRIKKYTLTSALFDSVIGCGANGLMAFNVDSSKIQLWLEGLSSL